MMEIHSKFKFAGSSALIFLWLRDYFPEIFEKVSKYVKEGRIEIVGGSLNEHNANLPCGEALLRNYLYGKRLFKELFNVDVKIGWLPDTFGFAWTLPQILRKCGINYFVTAKLRWQIERNKPPIPFPYNIFLWIAPDGSTILSYQTVGGYSTPLNKYQLLELWNSFLDRHRCSSVMVLYGKGDHGGGIVREMLNSIDMFSHDPQMPEIIYSTPSEFFNEIESSNITIPRYMDELYVKTHRGTYTTEAFVKKYNRYLETLLLLTERTATLAWIYGMPNPRDELRDLWYELLLTHVHDNLDGTSIEEVYQDTYIRYRNLEYDALDLLTLSLNHLVELTDTSDFSSPLVVYNPLPWERDGFILLKNHDGSLEDHKGNVLPSQRIGENSLVYVRNLPPLGLRTYGLVDRHGRAVDQLKVGKYFLENKFVKVSLNPETGTLTIYDKKSGRALGKKGGLAELECYVDMPDDAPSGEPAWNINLKDRVPIILKEIKIGDRGPLKASIHLKYLLASSVIEEEVILNPWLRGVEISIRVSWREHYKFLKIAFPTDFKCLWATYEIPFGAIQRFDSGLKKDPEVMLQLPTRRWEPADMLKTEVPALRWVDVSSLGGEIGFSIVNDSKYGYSLQDGVLRISLLRAARRGYPSTPESWTDQSEKYYIGEHEMSLIIFVHDGDWRKRNIPREAEEFTMQPVAIYTSPHKGCFPPEFSFLKIEPENLLLAGFKPCEDNDTLVMRIYDSHLKGDVECLIETSLPISSGVETDMMEWGLYVDPKKIEVDENLITVKMKKAEIKTMKFQIQRNNK